MDDTSAIATAQASLPIDASDSFHQLKVPLLSDDIHVGVRAITRLFTGAEEKACVRSYYHVLETTNSIPNFKIGSRTCVRESSVRAKFWSQEARSWSTPEEELLVKTHILLSAVLSMLAVPSAAARSAEHTRQFAAVVAELVPTIEQLIRMDKPS